MHIVVDARMIDASGIGVYLVNILTELGNSFQVTLLGNRVKLAKFKFTAEIIEFDVPIYTINEQVSLRNLIPACDLFWSPHYNIPLLPIKAKKRVVTIHDVFHLAYSEQLSFSQRIYSKIVINAAVRLSDMIITVSNFSKNELKLYTGVESSKVNVISNGVKSSTAPKDFELTGEKYGIFKNYILFVGNVKPHKNLKNLLAAYLLLDSSIQERYKIVIVGKKDGFITGDAKLFDWIEQNSGLKNNIIFTGFVADADMDTLYHNASLFVFPSIYEGFGLPPIEAMSNGCPVIVSDRSCMPEICGDAAIYFNPFDEKQISEKMTDVLTSESLQNNLRERGKFITEKYNWKTSASQHVDLFCNLLKN